MVVRLHLIAVVASLSLACHAQHSPDPKLREAMISGDLIDGVVSLQQKPLKSVRVRLISRDKTVWVGSTNNVGSFLIKHQHPGTYRLTVAGWGSVTVHLNPKKSSMTGPEPQDVLMLEDNQCVWAVTVIN